MKQSHDKALVKNAADKQQVKDAKRKERSLEVDQELDLQFVLSSKQGRRFMWRVLSQCKVFGSVWEPSARIHYNAGMQDVGHWLMALINDADQDNFLKMIKENRKDDNV